jgi:hypothetical protein
MNPKNVCPFSILFNAPTERGSLFAELRQPDPQLTQLARSDLAEAEFRCVACGSVYAKDDSFCFSCCGGIETNALYDRLESGLDRIYSLSRNALEFRNFSVSVKHPQHKIVSSVVSVLDDALSVDSSIHADSVEVVDKVERWNKLTDVVKTLAAASKDQINLEFRDKMFTTCRSTLIKTPWFEAQVTRWEPDPDTGAYFIDRNPRFVDLILDYFEER